jgi:hypothetical protein
MAALGGDFASGMPKVGLASLRCAAFRNSTPMGHVAFALAGVRHG